MPDFQYKLSNGKTLTLSGDTHPSDEEVENIAKQNGVELMPVTNNANSQKDNAVAPPPSGDGEGLLSSLYHKATAPLTDLPSRFAREVSNYINPDRGTTGIRGVGSAFIEGLGDVASGLTSPLNVATAALTAGGSMLPESIGAASRFGAGVLSAPVAAHGGYELATGDSWPDRIGGALELGMGGLGMTQMMPRTPNIPMPEAVPEMAAQDLRLQSSQPIQQPIEASVAPVQANPPIEAVSPDLTPDQYRANAASEINGIRQDVRSQIPLFEPNKPLEMPNANNPVIRPRMETPAQEPSKPQQAYDLARGMMSVDLPFTTSAAFRQASPLAFTREWFQSWAPSVKSYGSKASYDKIMTDIESRPLFKERSTPIINKETGFPLYNTEDRPIHKPTPSIAQEAGLKLTDVGTYSKREEAIRGSLAEKIPVYGQHIAASNRAYTAFLNSLRANKFENLVNDAKSEGLDPIKNLPLLKELAEFVNTTTGAGKLGIELGKHQVDLERNTKLLANIFFSPRKIASEVRMLNPSTYVFAQPQVRKEYAKALLRRMATWWTMAGLAQMGGAAVSKDPTNPDFGKIRIGKTRIDPPGGMQQFLVLAAQSGMGGKTSSTTPNAKMTPFGQGYKPETMGGNIVNFGINRLHPTARFAYDLMTATNSKPVGVGDRMLQLAAPMFADDLMSVLNENPALAAATLGANTLGMGTQSYTRGDFGKPKFIPNQSDLVLGGKKKKR